MTIFSIHIIEDEQHTANLLGDIVKLMGYKANIYTQAQDFFATNKQFQENSIIILDLNMPEMDGIEVIRRLAKVANAPALILVSGYDQGVLHSAEQLAQAHALSVIASLTKPLEVKILQSVIQKYIQNKPSENTKVPLDELCLTVSELKTAILKNQLVVHYQPQINLKKGTLSGVEALVRWQHPEHGIIYPNLFIPLAENSGLINGISEEVIKQAVAQAMSWKEAGLVTQISVNLSANDIKSLTLPEQLGYLFNSIQLDPSMVTLEVTESSLMEELATSLDILTRLRMKGIELSIDDFGTGYSSLSQLYRVPFTELKIDLSFVTKMSHDDEARGIVKTCIMLGHELKMRVVAEGVEDKQTLNLLKQLECDIAQGFYIAKPMSGDALLTWFQTGNFG